jgi:hypothetical protein
LLQKFLNCGARCEKNKTHYNTSISVTREK